MKISKNAALIILLSLIFVYAMGLIESTYLVTFLKSQLIIIQITLLAINTATLGLIATKLNELILKYNVDFKDTIYQMKLSLVEQIVLIILSVLILTLFDSKVLNFINKVFILDVGLVSVFFYSIYILWDTGKAIFILLDGFVKDDSDEEN